MSTAEVSCTECGKRFEVATNYFRKFGADPFCRDCLIHTECRSCNRGLRLRPSRYQELGGDPVVCTACGPSTDPSDSETDSSNASFWHGLTIGEKIVFPLLVLAFVGLAGYYWTSGTSGTSGGGLLGLLALIYWTYRRGVTNDPHRN